MLKMQSFTTDKLKQVAKRLLLITILCAIAVVTVGCGPSTQPPPSDSDGLQPPAKQAQTAEVDKWEFSLYETKWVGGTVSINLAITNHGPRRNFGDISSLTEPPGPRLVVIDYTGKWVEPWTPSIGLEEMEKSFEESGTIPFYTVPSYTKEFYPEERWEGKLEFRMNPYTKNVKLYLNRCYSCSETKFLFNLGNPA